MTTKWQEVTGMWGFALEWIIFGHTESYPESRNVEDYSDLAVKVPEKSERKQHMNRCDYNEDDKWQLLSNVMDFTD